MFFIGCNVSDKRSKEIGPSSLKDSGERVESCVDFIILLPDYPIDLPLYSHLLHHSFYHEVGLFFIVHFCISFILQLLPTFFLFSIILTGGLKNRG